MPPGKPVVVGSRGSPLALRQTQEIIDQLRPLYPDHEFRVQVIKTKGDEAKELAFSAFRERGFFVRELETALLQGEIDLAVHSLKDLPGGERYGLKIAAVSRRADPRDVLVSRDQRPLTQLPHGALLGTSSARRVAQLQAFRPDLHFADIRGNVDTRLRKVAQGDCDGIVLAAAGLLRLGLGERITEYLPPEICLPAVGQGVLAVQVRADDAAILRLVAPLEDKPTRQAITAERAFLEGLGGGCQVPIAALGRVSEDYLDLDGLVSSRDGQEVIRLQVRGLASAAEALGRYLAERLLDEGAREILSEVRP